VWTFSKPQLAPALSRVAVGVSVRTTSSGANEGVALSVSVEASSDLAVDVGVSMAGDGVGKGESGGGAVAGGVSVAPASMTRGVAVGDGTSSGVGVAVSVARVSVKGVPLCTVPSAVDSSRRVALGTMVMRDTRVGGGVGVKRLTGVVPVGEGQGVGVGWLREQATKARGMIKDQINRFMFFPLGSIAH